MSEQWRHVVIAGSQTARVVRAVLLIGGVLFAVLPAFVLPYVEGRLWTEILATTIVLWGLSLLMGPARQLSLGHAAFAGLGAYSTAIVAARYGWPALVGLAVATVVGFV